MTQTIFFRKALTLIKQLIGFSKHYLGRMDKFILTFMEERSSRPNLSPKVRECSFFP